jgi:hypothetical protein
MPNVIFWDVKQCGSLILVIPMMGALCSFETPVLTRATWRNIPEDDILQSHRRENLKSYMKNAFFWDITSCGSCKTRHFGGT